MIVGGRWGVWFHKGCIILSLYAINLMSKLREKRAFVWVGVVCIHNVMLGCFDQIFVFLETLLVGLFRADF